MEKETGSTVVDPPVLSPEMDSSTEKGARALDPDERPLASGETKACNECHTTKTPLWRGGPCGPLSLCNACGIRYRKRREAMGLDSSIKAGGGNKQQRKKKGTTAAAAASKQEREREAADKVTVELHAMGFSKEVVLKHRRQMRRRQRLSEEERAAILLMALSSGVVYA